MRHYETTFVVDAHLQDEAIEKSVDKFLKFIENSGGKVGIVDRWGKRRLAYEINKKQYGYYVCVRYEAEGTFIQELERAFQLDDDILRSLTIQVPQSVLKEERENPAAIKMVKPTDDEAVDDIAVPGSGRDRTDEAVEKIESTEDQPAAEVPVEESAEEKAEEPAEVEAEEPAVEPDVKETEEKAEEPKKEEKTAAPDETA